MKWTDLPQEMQKRLTFSIYDYDAGTDFVTTFTHHMRNSIGELGLGFDFGVPKAGIRVSGVAYISRSKTAPIADLSFDETIKLSEQNTKRISNLALSVEGDIEDFIKNSQSLPKIINRG